MDGEGGWHGANALYVVFGVAMGVDAVHKQLHLFAFNETEVEVHGACFPVGDAAHIPCVALAASLNHIFTNFCREYTAFVPHHRHFADKIETFRLCLVVGGRVA